jgi:hypothetical protein
MHRQRLVAGETPTAPDRMLRPIAYA